MKKISIREYFEIMVKWRNIIIFNVLAITLLTIVISLVIPQKWTAVTTILPPTEETNMMGLSSLYGAGFGGMLGGGALSRMLPGMATISDLFARELESKRIVLEVIDRNELKKLYKTKFDEDAIRQLKEFTSIAVSPEGIITIIVTERTPKLAAQIANSYVEELDRFNREVNMTFGKKNRIFLEERLEEVKRDLSEAEESLRVFRELHKTVSITNEMKAAIEVVSDVKSKIMAYEVQLGMLQSYSSWNNPEITRLQNEIAQLKRKEREIEKLGKGEEGFGAGFSIPFSKLPGISLELARRVRNMVVQESLFKLIVEQYEQAKIMEVRDTPTVQVLDRASPPERRSFPRRKKMVVVAFIFSIFIGVGIAFVMEFSEKIGEMREGEKWLAMGKVLMGDLNKILKKFKRTKRLKEKDAKRKNRE